MTVEVRVPELGESVVEATVGRWLKREGDAVAADEPLVELETEKVNLEVPAPTSGVLGQILKAEGETVRVGEALARVEGGAAQPAPPGQASVAASPPRHVATPLARKLAAAKGIAVQNLEGTGLGGRVRLEDLSGQALGKADTTGDSTPVGEVQVATPSSSGAIRPEGPGEAASAAEPSAVVAAETTRKEERVHLSRRRLTIARRLLEAQRNSASLTTFNEIDLSAVQALRRRRGEEFLRRHGVELGLMSFFTKAAIGALKAYPQLNAELQGEDLVLKHYYDIGIAVSVEGGLVVPVVRDADRKSFAAIEREIGELAAKARENRLELSDLQGGTFTITNGGVFGSLLSTPILNTPQVGILGMHKIEERPVVSGGEIVIRPMMYVALTYDHRVVDGHEAVEFLVTVKRLVEDPESLLLEG